MMASWEARALGRLRLGVDEYASLLTYGIEKPRTMPGLSVGPHLGMSRAMNRAQRSTLEQRCGCFQEMRLHLPVDLFPVHFAEIVVVLQVLDGRKRGRD